jgi:hypothetical protein
MLLFRTKVSDYYGDLYGEIGEESQLNGIVHYTPWLEGLTMVREVPGSKPEPANFSRLGKVSEY